MVHYREEKRCRWILQYWLAPSQVVPEIIDVISNCLAIILANIGKDLCILRMFSGPEAASQVSSFWYIICSSSSSWCCAENQEVETLFKQPYLSTSVGSPISVLTIATLSTLCDRGIFQPSDSYPMDQDPRCSTCRFNRVSEATNRPLDHHT